MKEISLIPLGGASEIGANSYYVRWRGSHRLALDFGLRGEGPTLDSLPAYHKVDAKPEFIFITHAHADHLGALPYAEGNFLAPKGKIFMTPETRDIARHMLIDTGKIMGKAKNTFADWQLKLYSPANIERILRERVVTVGFGDYVGLGDPMGLAFRFIPAGHVAGAAMVELKSHDFSMLYTGDFSSSRSVLQAPCAVPSGLRPDVLVCEGTSGAAQRRETMQQRLDKFAGIINAAAEKGSGTLVPAFALGRSQEVLAAIGRLKEEGKIKDVPVYISGGLTEVLTNHYKAVHKFPAHTVAWPNKIPSGPFIYIATSGFFAPGSPAFQMAERMATDKNSAIVFPSSFARANSIFTKWCAAKDYRGVRESLDFSAHASFSEVQEFVRKMKAPVTVFIHGNKENLHELRRSLRAPGHDIMAPSFNGEELLFSKNSSGQVRCKSSANSMAYVITVGTSLTGNIERLIDDAEIPEESMTTEFVGQMLERFTTSVKPRQSCAEINTLINIAGLDREDLCLLIATAGTARGAGLLEKVFLPMIGLRRSYTTTVSYNDGGATLRHEKEAGVNEFVSALCMLLERYPMAEVVSTGGYKFQTALAYMTGTLLGRNVYYRNEMTPPHEPSMRIPSYPLRMDTQFYRQYSDRIESLLRQDEKQARAVYGRLPAIIKNLLIHDEKRFRLSVMGILMRFMARKELELQGRAAANTLMKPGAFNPELWACPAPADNAAPQYASLRNETVREFLLRMAGDPAAISVRFEPLTQDPAVPAGTAELRYNACSADKVRYLLAAGGRRQYVTVKVVQGQARNLIRRVGLEKGGVIRAGAQV